MATPLAGGACRTSGQPDWLVPAIRVLAAVLALVAGLVVMVARHTGRRVRAEQAA
jgi:hypothetical protein